MPTLNDTQKTAILRQARTIAIIGLSPDAQKPSYQVAQFLQAQGYVIMPIYPKGGEILGVKAYPTLRECYLAAMESNITIDIIDVFRKEEALPLVAQEIVDLASELPQMTLPQCVWVQLGLRSKAASEILRQAHIAYEEDSCIKLEYKRLITHA